MSENKVSKEKIDALAERLVLVATKDKPMKYDERILLQEVLSDGIEIGIELGKGEAYNAMHKKLKDEIEKVDLQDGA